jgi:hypothetical protein
VPLLDLVNADWHMAWRMCEVELRLNEPVIPPSPATREAFGRFMRTGIAHRAKVITDANIPKM